MTEKEIIEQEIRNLQADLNATDYKVIKCSEAQILGEQLPYDMATLHVERQTIRTRINELQEELKNYTE